MSRKLFILPLIITVGAPGLTQAAPVNLWSDLSYSHGYQINGGAYAAGLNIRRVPATLVVDTARSATVDEPTALTTAGNTVQIGNPFSDPVLPFKNRGVTTTYVPAGVDRFARAAYDISTTQAVANDGADAPIILSQYSSKRDDNSGRAETRSDTGQSDVHARSRYAAERAYRIENTSNQTRNVPVIGTLDFAMTSRATAEAGEARASLTAYSRLNLSTGASVFAQFLTPFQADYDQSVSGAFALAQPVVDQDGMDFTAFTRAFADPAQTLAAVEGSFDYSFALRLEPGAHVDIVTGFTQFNYVDYAVPDVPTAPVPLPASFGFLFAAAVGVFAMRR